MKKQSKIILAMIAVLIVVVAILAVVHLQTREQVPEGALAIHYQDDVTYVDVASLQLETVSGTVINGKGEEMEVNAQGAALADVLKEAGIDPALVGAVTVTAEDAYSAELTGEELNETGKVYLSADEDGVSLVVFGDENMKRNVRDVVSVDVAD